MKKRLIFVVLASASPRRQEMLEQLKIPFRVCISPVEEIWDASALPEKVAVKLAREKAQSVPAGEALVIAMDTMVAIGKKKLGKPVDHKDAERMLRSLSGKSHHVYTGVALRLGNKTVSDFEKTEVTFRKMSADEIHRYVKSGEPEGKAGAYAIQGSGRIFITSIHGCYFNVVGFPIGCFQRLLKRLGLTIFDLVS